MGDTTIIKGDLKKEIQAMKGLDRQDIIVYGGNSFVASLIEHGLVDEFYLLMNPLAISPNEPIFDFINSSIPLQWKACKPFKCGTVLLTYNYEPGWSPETKNITV